MFCFYKEIVEDRNSSVYDWSFNTSTRLAFQPSNKTYGFSDESQRTTISINSDAFK